MERSLVALVHGVAKSQTWLSMHAHTHTHTHTHMNVSVGKFSDTEVGSKKWQPPKLHQRPICPQLPQFSCTAWPTLTVDILLQGRETGVISKYKHAPQIDQWGRIFEVRAVLDVGWLELWWILGFMGQCFFSSFLLRANVDMVSCSVHVSYCKRHRCLILL